ncbi:hypothetical protein [Leifsonia sp. fls2-241-R2A-40a]|uniref:hypothetical protein n=1 Tax=Leifsonia sp. fls2-241-R2A-40a TaxID=3040290 RepID=UPI0025518DD2|nr:hypothetical protein [Leifsonia sp. fls2-241-R2A-40a]
MTGMPSKGPWWARSTGGNRGWALTSAIVYSLVFAVDAARWLTRGDWFAGVLAIALLVLAVWAWATVVYLSRRTEEGRRRGW